MNSKVLVLWTTLPTAEAAAELARALVEERLAACAQIDAPIRSIYRWEGVIQDESEIRLLLKSTRECWPRLRRRLSELHPYSTPQIVALDAEASEAYAAWVHDEATPGS